MTEVERERRENQPLSTLTVERPIGTRHVQILLDRSGSMASIKAAMEEGFVGFLTEQRAIPGAEAIKFVLTQFDNVAVEDVDIGTLQSAKPMTLLPRGGTPLYDAIGATIATAEKRMAEDDVMLFVIITDGYENASTKFSREQVQKLIAEKMDKGWAFIYLGANQDAWAVGGAMGMAQGTTLNYNANAAGVRQMSGAVSSTTTGYRMSETRAEVKGLKIEVPTKEVKLEEKEEPEKK